MKKPREFFSAQEYHLAMLNFWNDNFIPKDPRKYAIKKLIEKHGSLSVDVPEASDSKGSFQYGRYSIGIFLKELLNEPRAIQSKAKRVKRKTSRPKRISKAGKTNA